MKRHRKGATILSVIAETFASEMALDPHEESSIAQWMLGGDVVWLALHMPPNWDSRWTPRGYARAQD